jgi:hypothetical protein
MHFLKKPYGAEIKIGKIMPKKNEKKEEKTNTSKKGLQRDNKKQKSKKTKISKKPSIK